VEDEVLKFRVADLKRIHSMVGSVDSEEEPSLSRYLRKVQPHFSKMIEEVGWDPRCVEAHRFCTLFCALALSHAELSAEDRIPACPAYTIQDVVRAVARRDRPQIGSRACSFPGRVRRYAIPKDHFDEDDTAWLCTTISAFLILLEHQVCGKS
jgi:hypothetical protein